MFKNRTQAAQQLASRLMGYQEQHPLVLGVPRGAVPMARQVAQALKGDFDVVLVRKLGAPGNPEFAIGAVAENGWVYTSPDAALVGADAPYLAAEKARQMETIAARRRQYSAVHASVAVKGRVVIVIDDGLATGATMIAALHALREAGPARLVCAVPVAPPDTVARIEPLCDELVCLLCPSHFHAVGQFYTEFEQVSDAEVLACLREPL